MDILRSKLVYVSSLEIAGSLSTFSLDGKSSKIKAVEQMAKICFTELQQK
jgi:hypothetical protein